MEKFETFNELILALLLWITTHTDYKEPKIFPKIQFIEQKALAEMACGRECEILALTPDNPKYTIFLAIYFPKDRFAKSVIKKAIG